MGRKATEGSFKKGHIGYWRGKNNPKSQETKDKISKKLMGHSVSEKVRKAEKSPFKKGFTPWNRGVACPEETKKKISETNKRKGIEPSIKNKFSRGDKHPNWRGGNRVSLYSIDWTQTFKKSIRERDHYICQLCLKNGFPVHHIDYNKKNCNPENLITLCISCHNKTNHHREYWIQYFKMYEYKT